MLYASPGITAYCITLAVLLGACLGSFLNCMAWRIVHGEAVTKGRSHCDRCGHVLGVRDLVPVVSWLVGRGRCRYCGEKISAGHVVAELVSAAVVLSALLKFNISLRFVEYLLFGCLLLVMSFADMEGYIIPDRFIVAAIAVRAVFILISGDIWRELVFSLLGGCSVALVLWGVTFLMEKLRHKEMMGGGDLKLIFVTGLYLGWKCNVLCLLVACVLGIIFGMATKSREDAPEKGAFPWGPSIAAAAWLCLLFGEAVIDAYLGMF